MATPNIVPRGDSEGGLGTTSKYWASAYIDTIITTGNITVGGGITVTGEFITLQNVGSEKPAITLISSSNDDEAGHLQFRKDRGQAPVDGDTLGSILFQGEDSTQALTTYAEIRSDIHETTHGDESGEIFLSVANNGTLQTGLFMKGDKTTAAQVDVTIGNGAASKVNVPGKLGVGTTAPGTVLQITGTEPYLTLKNSTGEFTNHGCESKIIFEDHGNNALGGIQVSHESDQDDEKGEMFFQVNNDSGLQDAISINSSLNTTFASHVNLPDNAILKLGTSADLQFYHNATDSYIDSTNGHLYIRSTAQDKDIVIQGNDGGSTITALEFDMSDGGHATFSSKITSGNDILNAADGVYTWVGDTDTFIQRSAANEITFKTTGATALVLNSSQNATFGGTVAGTSFNGIPFFSDATITR